MNLNYKVNARLSSSLLFLIGFLIIILADNKTSYLTILHAIVMMTPLVVYIAVNVFRFLRQKEMIEKSVRVVLFLLAIIILRYGNNDTSWWTIISALLMMTPLGFSSLKAIKNRLQ